MAMKPNLPLAPSIWHDFYAVTEFAPGADVVGCNVGDTRICLFEGDKPADDVAVQGWEIPVGGGFRVKADGGKAWIRGNGGVVLGGLQEYAE